MSSCETPSDPSSSAASRPVRSLPAAQWNTAGSASGSASTSNAFANRGAPICQHVSVRPDQEVLVAIEVWAAPRAPGLVDDWQVVEDDRVGVDRESSALVELRIAAQVDDRVEAERLECFDVGRLSGGTGRRRDTAPATRVRAAIRRRVSAEVSEVVHRLERYEPFRSRIRGRRGGQRSRCPGYPARCDGVPLIR